MTNYKNLLNVEIGAKLIFVDISANTPSIVTVKRLTKTKIITLPNGCYSRKTGVKLGEKSRFKSYVRLPQDGELEQVKFQKEQDMLCRELKIICCRLRFKKYNDKLSKALEQTANTLRPFLLENDV